MWFASNGYVCLIIDTLQLGEIAGIHHGTYGTPTALSRSREPLVVASRGYTPAGVECWNGVRAIDYLVSRPDVDAGPDRRHRHLRRRGGDVLDRRRRRARQGGRAGQRHERPGELRQEQGHQRPLRLHVPVQHLPVGVDDDRRPGRPAAAAVRQLATTTASSRWTATAASSRGCGKLYKMYGKPELVDEYVSKGGHDYRPDLRIAIFKCINKHLKGDTTAPVKDARVQAAARQGAARVPGGQGHAEGRDQRQDR